MDGITVRTLAYHIDRAIEMHGINKPQWVDQILDSIYDSGDTMLSHGYQMVYIQTDDGILYYPNDYDEDVRQKFDHKVSEGDCVIDIGASLGYYTLRAADLVGDDGTVYAFEPEPSRYEALKKSIQTNGLEERVWHSDTPVADVEGDINIRERTAKEKWTTRTTNATTLDAAVDIQPDIIKIDCEGLEYHVLKGARELIAESKPDIFGEIHPSLIEANGYSTRDIESFAAEMDYNMYCIDSRSPTQIESIPTGTEYSLASATVLFTQE